MRVRGQSGQASLEYAVVIGVVASAVAVGAAAARGDQIAGAVTGQMARAVCVVSSGDCDRDRAPCVRSSQRTTSSGHVNALVLRLGGEAVGIVEERSDGTFVVTRMTGGSAGLDVGVGADAGLSLGGRSFLVGGELRAAVLAHLGRGRTWVVRSRSAAEDLVGILGRKLPTAGRGTARRVKRSLGPPLPPPDQTFGDKGWSVTLGANGGVGPGQASLTLTAKDVAGSRLDVRTGHRTVYLRRTNGLKAAVEMGRRLAGAGGAGSLAGVYSYSVEFDRDGRPLDLAVVESGAFEGSADLPTRAQPVAGMLGIPTKGARMQETETHLDLTDGASLAAARDFIAQVNDPSPGLGALAKVSAALERRLDEAGTVQARTYETGGRTYGGSGHLAGGLKVGGAYERSTHTSTLLAAYSRGRDGQWTARRDCVRELRVDAVEPRLEHRLARRGVDVVR